MENKITISTNTSSKTLDHKINKSCNILASSKTFTDESINKKNITYKINRLHELISDPITRENMIWIDRLLNSFLRDMKHRGYKLKYLPAVTELLQFLAWKANDIPGYKIHLNNMIKLSSYPLLLEKSSDNISYSEILDFYFTVLGYLTILLPHEDQIINILKTFNKLLVRPTSFDVFMVKLDVYHRSIEKSQVSIIFVKLIEISSPGIYRNVLDTAQIILSISHICCHKMLKAGILNYLLVRMNDKSSLDTSVKLEKNSVKVNENIIVINILFLLMESIFPPQTLPEALKKLPAPSPAAMRSLRDIFEQVTVYSGTNCKILTIRNNLATIIFMGLVALPSLPIVNFDLAEDIIKILITKELKNNEDVFFKKILFSIVCQFSYFNSLLLVMTESCVIEKILRFLDNNINRTTSSSNYLNLLPNALRTLTFLVPKIPDDFIKYNGPMKLFQLLNQSMTEPINIEMTLEIVKTFCPIVTFECLSLLIQLREVEAIPTFLKYIEIIINFDRLTIHYQKILTFIIITIDMIITSDFDVISIYGNKLIEIFVNLLKRCQNQEKKDFISNERLLIGIGSCLWECIIQSSVMINKLVEMGGPNLILDLIDQSNYLIQNVYLGLLTDLCFSSLCIPYICTWRGADKTKTLISLLARVWRDEENRIGVKRTPDDLELPLMGIDQYKKNILIKNHGDFSPAIAAIFGSIRPKVYSIRKILLVDSEICEQLREHYKIFLYDLPIEDSITFCIVDKFFRFVQGQVWAEVISHIKQFGIIPVGTDGEMLLVMRQRHRKYALYVRDCQEKLLRDLKRHEMIKERNELIKIRNAALSSILIAFQRMIKKKAFE
ncbi:cilia- and flagella-associated protein 69-like [Microplitis mediator]|uniref:cilia- and flagella-associated protein 69-like n=1 Tax=Microplitis mediator TaxID=375433 RepID=UPI0025562EA5|nr:cilia- and flagella-associated protein 69-like [Microplitis mediator]